MRRCALTSMMSSRCMSPRSYDSRPRSLSTQCKAGENQRKAGATRTGGPAWSSTQPEFRPVHLSRSFPFISDMRVLTRSNAAGIELSLSEA